MLPATTAACGGEAGALRSTSAVRCSISARALECAERDPGSDPEGGRDPGSPPLDGREFWKDEDRNDGRLDSGAAVVGVSAQPRVSFPVQLPARVVAVFESGGGREALDLLGTCWSSIFSGLLEALEACSGTSAFVPCIFLL